VAIGGLRIATATSVCGPDRERGYFSQVESALTIPKLGGIDDEVRELLVRHGRCDLGRPRR